MSSIITSLLFSVLSIALSTNMFYQLQQPRNPYDMPNEVFCGFGILIAFLAILFACISWGNPYFLISMIVAVLSTILFLGIFLGIYVGAEMETR